MKNLTIFNSKYFLFADNLKPYHTINNVHNFILLQSEIDSVQHWCFENSAILNVVEPTLT